MRGRETEAERLFYFEKIHKYQAFWATDLFLRKEGLMLMQAM